VACKCLQNSHGYLLSIEDERSKFLEALEATDPLPSSGSICRKARVNFESETGTSAFGDRRRKFQCHSHGFACSSFSSLVTPSGEPYYVYHIRKISCMNGPSDRLQSLQDSWKLYH